MAVFDKKFTAAEYTRMIFGLIPIGAIWPRDKNTTLHKFIEGHAEELERVDAQINNLLKESFPEFAETLLKEWQIETGFPDGEIKIPASIADQQNQITSRITNFFDFFQNSTPLPNPEDASLSENFFKSLADFYGYTIDFFRYNYAFAMGAGGAVQVTDTGLISIVGSAVVTGVTGAFRKNQYIFMGKGFNIPEIQIIDVGVGTITLDEIALSSETGITGKSFNEWERPFGMGDKIGENFRHEFEIDVTLAVGQTVILLAFVMNKYKPAQTQVVINTF